ncbi:MAG: hypothetical protein V4657_12430 [Pseudomonadota bacterium]
MAKYQNIAAGDRGIRSVDGLVMVPAGEVFDGELAKGEEVNEEWFAAPKAAKAEPKPEAKAESK